jgi:cytochrome c-type biogenesis protein CcmH/NrfG
LLSRQGDCTEHAVLFAALARALGIPTRVAIGLIYVPNGDSNLGRFVYHMWDEIYLSDRDYGEWVPIDATNPEPMPDATHIKIADSALSSTSDLMMLTQNVVALMGKMKIDILKAMSSAQSTLTVGKQSGVLAVDIPKVDIEQVDIRTLSRKAIKHFRVQLPPASLSMDTADGLFTYGVESLSKGQYDSAKRAFEQSLTKVRRPIEAYRMGERLAAIEMYELAGSAFQMAREKDPALAPLVDSWMSAYLPARNLPDSLNRQFMAAMYAQGDPQDSLQTVTEQAPWFAPGFRHLGELSSGETSIEMLKTAVTLAPQDFRNNESLGDALMDQERYGSATQAYRAACVALMQTRFAQSKTWLDDVHGKWELAYGSALLAKNKHDASGWLTIAKGLLRQSRYDEVEQALHNALILRPGYSEAQLYSFELAMKRSDWHQIFALKDRVAPMASHNVPAAALLGQYQMHTRQYGPAVQSLQHAIALNSKAVDAYLTLSQTYLRMAEQQDVKKAAKLGGLGDKLRNQAVTILRRGLASVSALSDRDEISLQLATRLLDAGKGAEAQSLAEQVLADDPINGRAYLLKGKAQFYQGNYREARDTLETALVLNPNDPSGLVLLGHVAQEEGRDAIAMDAYQKAYKADPLNEDAAKSYSALLAKMQIVGKKPPNYWYLSDDEHDYLVQLLYQGKQIKANTRNYLAKLAALPGHSGQVEFSVQGIAAIQSFPPFINQLFETELNGYHRLQAMNVPPRFAPMHALLLETSLGHLKIFDNAVQRFPTMNKITPQTALSFKALLSGINGIDQSLSSVLSLISSRLPEPVYQGLLSEAQLNDLPALDQEIARLTTDLATRKAPKSSKLSQSKQVGPDDKATSKTDDKSEPAPDATGTAQVEKQINQMTAGPQSNLLGKP